MSVTNLALPKNTFSFDGLSFMFQRFCWWAQNAWTLAQSQRSSANVPKLMFKFVKRTFSHYRFFQTLVHNGVGLLLEQKCKGKRIWRNIEFPRLNNTNLGQILPFHLQKYDVLMGQTGVWVDANRTSNTPEEEHIGKLATVTTGNGY